MATVMLRSCVLALKGCDSTLISLDGRIIESKLIKKFKILLVQRRLINIALDNMLIAIVDPSVSAFVSCMRYWIFLVDSSLDFILDDLQSKTLGPAGLLSKVHLQIQIIRWLFAIIAPHSMLSTTQEDQFVNWDSLALIVYNTSRFWERFPYRYDLLAMLGTKIHGTQILLDDYVTKRTKRVFHRDKIDPPMIVEAYIQALLYRDLYNHVAAAMSNSNNINKFNNASLGSEVGVGSFPNIVSIDNQQLWQQQQLESQSHSDSTNLLFRVIQTLQSSSVMSTAFSAISSERNGVLVEALDLNPMNSFDYELETFVKKQFDAPPVSDDEKLRVIFQQQLNLPVVDMSSHVSAKDIPPPKPSPNKKKAAFFDHHPPPVTAPAIQKSNINNKVMITLPLGATKSVDKDLAAEAAQDMIQRFESTSQSADYRKAKAIWQIRRLKRLKVAKTELKKLYNDLGCAVYLTFNNGEKVSLPLHIEVKTDAAKDFDEEQGELPSESRFEEDWLSDTEEQMVKKNELPIEVEATPSLPQELPDTIDIKISEEPSSDALSRDAVLTSDKGLPITMGIASHPVSHFEGDEDEDEARKSEDGKDNADKEQQLDLVKHFQEDDSIAAEVNEELAEQKRIQAILARLRESLLINGLQAVLQGEESIRELCRDINTSLLLIGLANGAFTINFANSSNLIFSANEGQSSLTSLVKSGVELSYRGVLSLSDAYCLQMKVKDTQLSQHRNQVLLKQLVFKEQFLEHVKSFHEFFLMSSHHCSSFLFDACQHVVEKRFKRLIKRDVRHQQQLQHDEELWTRISLQLALREAMTYFSPTTASHFKQAKYRFTASQLQTMPSFQEVTWMDYTLPSSLEWSALLSCAELHHLKIAYEVPNELCRLFFAEEFMEDICKFTKRYLELGQFISCFRILSIEARRNTTMNDRQQQRGSNLHLQLFAVQQTIQSLLRYFNDRQVALMNNLYLMMRDQCHNGLQSLLSIWQEYGRDLRRATFTPTSNEMRITNAEIAHESLESGVLLKFCVEKILQECRLFAVRLFELLFHEVDEEDNDDDEERLIALEDELQVSAEKVEEYKLHIQELSRTVHQADTKEHVLRLEQLLCPQ